MCVCSISVLYNLSASREARAIGLNISTTLAHGRADREVTGGREGMTGDAILAGVSMNQALPIDLEVKLLFTRLESAQ